MMKAVIFDFDGLILDTETPQYESWQRVYDKYGVELPAQRWIDILGMPPHHTDLHAELEQALGRTLDRAVVKSGRNTELRAQIDAMELCAGIVDRLDEARQLGLKVGVASGSPREWVVGHLTRRGLVDHFQMIICCEDTSEHKPRPGPFLAVAEGLKVDPADCLVLEDSPNGIRSAHLAGMKAVAVPNPLTRTMQFPGADLVIESLSQTTLGELAEKLWPEPESD